MRLDKRKKNQNRNGTRFWAAGERELRWDHPTPLHPHTQTSSTRAPGRTLQAPSLGHRLQAQVKGKQGPFPQSAGVQGTLEKYAHR